MREKHVNINSVITENERLRSKRRRTGVLVSYLYTIAQVVVNLIYVPLLLSIIGRTEYGLYQTVGAIMSYLISVNSILSAGISRFYCMYKAKNDDKMMESTLSIAKRLYWGVSAVAVLVVVLLIPVMRAAYASSYTPVQLDECSAMLVVLAINMVITFNNTINIAAINANERFVFMKSTQLLTLVAQPFLIILLGRFFPNAITITVVVLVMNILCASVQRIYAQGFLRIRYTFHGWNKQLIRSLLGYSGTIVLVMVADQIFWNSGKLLIGYFSGADFVAVFGVGSQIYSAYLFAGMAISGVFFQRVSDLVHARHDMKAVSELFARVGRISFTALFLIFGGFLFLGKDFVTLWAGDEYLDAYWVAIAVMAPMTIDLIQNLGLTILQVLDKYAFRGYIYIVLSIANILISLIMIPRWGIVGAALSSGMCMFVGNGLIMNWYYRKYTGIDIGLFWKEVLRCGLPLVGVVFAMVIVRIIFPVKTLNWAELVILGLIYFASYCAIYWKFCSNEWERQSFCSVLMK